MWLLIIRSESSYVPFVDKNDSEISALVYQHLPGKLRELGADRIYERVPVEYIKCIVASAIASKIVYREGVLYVSEQIDSHLPVLAFNFLKTEAEVCDEPCRYPFQNVLAQSIEFQVQRVMDAIAAADFGGNEEARQQALRIMQKGGIRALQS